MPSDFYEGESPFQAIAESANDVIVVIDTDSRIQFVNQRAEDVFGYDPDELLDDPLTRLMPEWYHEGHHRGLTQDLSTGERTLDRSEIELPGLCHDGTEIPLRISFSEFTQNGEQYFVGVIREITEQKDRKRELQFKESLLEAKQEAMLDGVLLVDHDGDIISYNERFVELWDIPEDLIEKRDEEPALEWAMDHMADPEEFRKKVEYLYDNPRETTRDEIELADGRVFDRYSTPVMADDGTNYGRVWTFRDITDRKQRERQLENYKSLFENTNDCIIETTFTDGEPIIERVNVAFEDVFGYDESEVIGESLDDIIVPEGFHTEAEELTTIAEQGDEFAREVVRETADGRREFLLRPVHANENRSYAIYTDITEEKSRERELERAERRFDAVFNAPSALVTLLDTDGRIDEISDAAVALVSESREEIRGRLMWEGPWFVRDKTIQRQWREAVERALDGESARVETSVPLPDGELAVDAMFEPVTDAEGRLTGVVGVARDITEHHRDQRIRRQMLEATREMMTTESRGQLARTVSEAAGSVLDHGLNAVYLDEDADDTPLVPVAWSDSVEKVLDGPPAPSGEGAISEAYRDGEPVIYDDLEGATERPADRYAPVESLIVLPIGEYGVLAVGATEAGAFTEADVDRYRLLTVSAATAFDRLKRTLDLQRYETLFETVQDRVYVLDEDGTIELISESLAEAAGYDSDGLEGQHVSTIVTDETAKQVERLILDLLMAPEDVSNTCEGSLVARDGTELPIEIELSILPHEESFRGTAGVVRDISERRQREEELQVFRRAITKAGIGLIMYGSDGRFEYANDHYADMLGQTREELATARVWDIAENVSSETFDAYWESFETNETRINESEHRRRDDSTVSVETVTTAVEVGGTRRHIVTIQDITDRRERRQQAQALHRILRHNLRNDLTVLRGYADVLTRRLTGETREIADEIVDTADGLIDLTETAAEARQLLDRDTSRRPVNIAERVREQVRALRTRFDATVDLDVPDTETVLADPTVSVALKHLLTNAVEHNESPSPHVWVHISSMERRDGWVVVEIADDGPGIPDTETEPLSAGEEDQLEHGIGLGLWIVHWIVSRYGGDLSFEDRDPTGSRVRIALPKADAPPATVSTDIE